MLVVKIIPHFLDKAHLADLEKGLQNLDEWFTLGVVLNIPLEVLKEIQRKHKTTDECRSQMLVKWSEIEEPLWSKLRTALVEMNQTHHLASKLLPE